MKQSNIFFKSLGMLILLSSFSSCEKEDLNVLPVESQSGKNTFGCYVDSRLFVRSYGATITHTPYISAIYTKKSAFLEMYSENKDIGNFGFWIKNPKVNTLNRIYNVVFESSNHDLYSSKNMDYIYLTKFDTINKIVSGRFDYILKSESDSTLKINISKGRFDIKLDIFDN
jgi:hypothetical protein